MTGSIVAVFTCSVLVVAPTIPVHALETEGTVEVLDRATHRLTLSDGSMFGLPHGFDRWDLRAGTFARLVYEPSTS